jgi:hypothetical protein
MMDWLTIAIALTNWAKVRLGDWKRTKPSAR